MVFRFFKILYHYIAHNVMCYNRLLSVCHSYNLTDTHNLLHVFHWMSAGSAIVSYNDWLMFLGWGNVIYVSDLRRKKCPWETSGERCPGKCPGGMSISWWNKKYVSEMRWCICLSEWAICHFQRRADWRASKSDNRGSQSINQSIIYLNQAYRKQ